MNKKFNFISYTDITGFGGSCNVLGSFIKSLVIALNKYGNFLSFDDKQLIPKDLIDFVIAFNVSGCQCWQNVCDSGIKNVIWSVDSIFAQNFEVYRQFEGEQNFILLDVAPSDKNPIKYYMPRFTNCYYMPQATDLDLWKYENIKEENDVVFLAKIVDIEEKMDYISQKYPKNFYNIIKEMINFSLVNPELSFWDIYKYTQDIYGFEFDINVYHSVFEDVTSVCESTQKIKMVQALKDFNVKVYGNDIWNKYVQGNIKFCGQVDISESIKIINSSKIILHIQPIQLKRGLHERFLNAAAIKTFVMCGNDNYISSQFGNSFEFFNSKDYEDLPDKVSYYLKHADERNAMAECAYNIVKTNHTWDNRAKLIFEILGINLK